MKIFRILLLCAMVFNNAELLASQTKVAASPTSPSYAGVWRPTSFREGLNVGKLAISEKTLRVESSGALLDIQVVNTVSDVIVVEVIKRQPNNVFPGVHALAFKTEIDKYHRELLRIRYCESVKQCAKAPFEGGNAYVREK